MERADIMKGGLKPARFAEFFRVYLLFAKWSVRQYGWIGVWDSALLAAGLAWKGLLVFCAGRRAEPEIWRKRIRRCARCIIYEKKNKRCWMPVENTEPLGCGCYIPFLALYKTPHCWGNENIWRNGPRGWGAPQPKAYNENQIEKRIKRVPQNGWEAVQKDFEKVRRELEMAMTRLGLKNDFPAKKQ